MLQLDCPDLAMERARFFQDDSRSTGSCEIVDAARRRDQPRRRPGIPPDRIRLHVCWGNYDGPHTHDVPLEAILPLLYRARVGALSLPLANPRHQHEWRVFKRHPLPRHDAAPARRDRHHDQLRRASRRSWPTGSPPAVEAVGDRERVIASTDCGFGTFAGSEMVAHSVVWAKLAALREGAALATARLWGRR